MFDVGSEYMARFVEAADDALSSRVENDRMLPGTSLLTLMSTRKGLSSVSRT